MPQGDGVIGVEGVVLSTGGGGGGGGGGGDAEAIVEFAEPGLFIANIGSRPRVSIQPRLPLTS